jgi:ABC-type polysaccharide/polyol phosphate export permease
MKAETSMFTGRGLRSVVAQSPVWVHLGLRDLRVRYAHTIVGPWVSSIGVLLAGVASGLVMTSGQTFTLREVISIQLVKFSTWWLIASSITDAVSVSETDRTILINSTMSSGLLVMRLAFRNLLLAIHVQGALMLMFLAMGEWQILARSLLLSPIYLLVTVALYGPMLLLVHIGARSATLIRLTPPLTQLLMFLSPVLWTSLSIETLSTVLKLNPAYWMIVSSTEWVIYGQAQVDRLLPTVVFICLSMLFAEIILRRLDDMRLRIA